MRAPIGPSRDIPAGQNGSLKVTAGIAGRMATAVFMDTLVSIELVNPPESAAPTECIERAFGWFHEIEGRCSRFDPRSELSVLSRTAGVPVPVSQVLFAALEFALAVAGECQGAFDPTVGRAMVANGFDRNFRTGARVESAPGTGGTYRDVFLDRVNQAVTLRRPLLLDLGAVAKGLAIDLAARELDAFPDFAIDAGGDLFVRGCNAAGTPWAIGIRHPREPGAIVDTLHLSNAAVCTSGDYERLRPDGEPGHHIIDPATGSATSGVASVTVVAPTAMLADALATAAFVLGPEHGLALLRRHGVEGAIVSSEPKRHETPGFAGYRG